MLVHQKVIFYKAFEQCKCLSLSVQSIIYLFIYGSVNRTIGSYYVFPLALDCVNIGMALALLFSDKQCQKCRICF